MKTTRLLLSLAALATLSTAAGAQTTEPRETIAYDGAKVIVQTCERMAREKHWPIAIWVLDYKGVPLAFANTNGASEIGVDTARLKAETALKTGAPSEDRAVNLADPVRQRSTEVLGLFPIAGGLPLMKNGHVIGSVGAGGGQPENGMSVDKICAQAGIDAAFRK